MTQKGEALLVTKASLCFVPAPPAPPLEEDLGWQLVNTNVSNSVQTKAQISRMDFSGRIGFLGT
jgi:hypothetical protein